MHFGKTTSPSINALYLIGRLMLIREALQDREFENKYMNYMYIPSTNGDAFFILTRYSWSYL